MEEATVPKQVPFPTQLHQKPDCTRDDRKTKPTVVPKRTRGEHGPATSQAAPTYSAQPKQGEGGAGCSIVLQVAAHKGNS